METLPLMNAPFLGVMRTYAGRRGRMDDALLGLFHLQRHRVLRLGRRPSLRRILARRDAFVERHIDLMIVVIACASVVPVIASGAGGAILRRRRGANANASVE